MFSFGGAPKVTLAEAKRNRAQVVSSVSSFISLVAVIRAAPFVVEYIKEMMTELCNFSGFKIYPGHGKVFVKGDSRTFRFINGKCESYFMQRLKPSKLDWTVVFRRLHKKGITEEAAKKRTKRTVKAQRAVVGASLDAIKAKRTQKPEVRAAARQQALRQAKEKKADTEQKRKAEKAKSAATTRTAQPKAKFSKQAAKGVAAKPKATSR
ncbi:60S ribosomal protein L24 [Geranomyces variabilis]|nr:60S ribosomal protein L24 [Geranomyces variabilis]